MKITSEIKIYERDGNDVGFEGEIFKVESHWASTGKIDLVWNGVRLTVLADELIRAVHNGQNHK